MKSTDPFVVAMFRALLGGVLTGSATLFALLPTEASARVIVSGVGAAFVGYIMSRGGAEGWYDQRNKPDQNTPPASDLDNLDK